MLFLKRSMDEWGIVLSELKFNHMLDSHRCISAYMFTLFVFFFGGLTGILLHI